MKRWRKKGLEVTIATFGVEWMTWLNVDDHHLEKTFNFSDFIQALEFLNKAALLCEQQNHHADFELSWGKLLIRTWSHDVDSITERDHRLCKAIDGLGE
jgi:4a-hydroxytetrahydrobiopterin dehydratase